MRLTVISLVILIITPFVSALNITLTAPNSAVINEEFAVTIHTDQSDTLDVKIFVHNSQDSKVTRSEYISQIHNQDWQDSWYYLIASYPTQTEYKIRVIESPGEREICVRLRKNSIQATDDKCQPIVVEEERQQSQDNQEQESLENDTTESEIPVQTTEETVSGRVNTSEANNSLPRTLVAESHSQNEKILLNPMTNYSDFQEPVITKTEKIRLGIIYSFTAFCVIIIILLALRRL